MKEKEPKELKRFLMYCKVSPNEIYKFMKEIDRLDRLKEKQKSLNQQIDYKVDLIKKLIKELNLSKDNLQHFHRITKNKFDWLYP